ncbi:HNH endonuclease [Desulfohalobium retbaense]|uniref:Restriction endonuclease n=1 Tax=Desulfohalobium retbaense (strain ATCC 49708 / DSM 5692 / JCM 16813 / HR100) TaxID=485915 RepID=C8X334_DESRD|nr:HNH endonuclease [Desulfohalobium retbaense]ACV68831.1 restriction endonuclease [Desulfohalobium retbaense DSM 5692]
MKAFVGITDNNWFELLQSQPQLEEVNFWQPSGSRQFRALQPGELFLFKLHSPNNYIVGGGIFAHATRLPISLAWESFGIANGAWDLPQMRSRVARYRRQEEDRRADYTIGCILLEQPFFLERPAWIPVPHDWKPNIVQGRSYDLILEPGLSLWRQVQSALSISQRMHDEIPQYGEPQLVRPRLGQGTFRVLVTDAYERRCAVTQEKVLPALDAAHIRPFSEGGEHSITNGLLLRSDVHRLFDRGYVTVIPENHFEVSRKVREDFHNGRDYYALHGKKIWTPSDTGFQPNKDHLAWHNEKIFKI